MPEEARGRAVLRLLAKRLDPLDVHMERARPEARRSAARPPETAGGELLARATPFLHGSQPGYVDVMVWPFLADLHLRRLLDAAHLTRPATPIWTAPAPARRFTPPAPPWAATL